MYRKLSSFCTSEVSGQLDNPVMLPGRKNPGILWIGDWVGPRTGLDTVERKRNTLAIQYLSFLFPIQPLLDLRGSCVLENGRVNKKRVNQT
jgi:hypothetical protein